MTCSAVGPKHVVPHGAYWGLLKPFGANMGSTISPIPSCWITIHTSLNTRVSLSRGLERELRLILGPVQNQLLLPRGSKYGGRLRHSALLVKAYKETHIPQRKMFSRYSFWFPRRNGASPKSQKTRELKDHLKRCAT